jgi:hypothetical protein
MLLESRDERKAYLESLGLDAESVNSILDAEDDPSTLHEWSELDEVLRREKD